MTDLTGKITQQEIFDTAAKQLIAQGGASHDENGNCLYRGPDGRKCAAGAVIPDEIYDPVMEGKTIHCITTNLPHELQEHVGFLRILQAAHDYQLRCRGFDAWQERMREIAKMYELNTDALD